MTIIYLLVVLEVIQLLGSFFDRDLGSLLNEWFASVLFWKGKCMRTRELDHVAMIRRPVGKVTGRNAALLDIPTGFAGF